MTATQPVPATAVAGQTGLTFKQAVGNRRSIRFFRPYQQVDKAKVQEILEAVRLQSQHGNASLICKAVVVYRDETDAETFHGLGEALYNQPAAAQFRRGVRRAAQRPAPAQQHHQGVLPRQRSAAPPRAAGLDAHVSGQAISASDTAAL